MARKLEGRLRFEKIDAPDAKVHITLNGQPCEMWDAETFRNHPAGTRQASFAEFVAKPCGIRADGTTGSKGCVPELERGLLDSKVLAAATKAAMSMTDEEMDALAAQ
jgi:hypothetical protein